jgi:hypothetical protein
MQESRFSPSKVIWADIVWMHPVFRREIAAGAAAVHDVVPLQGSCRGVALQSWRYREARQGWLSCHVAAGRWMPPDSSINALRGKGISSWAQQQPASREGGKALKWL